MNPPPGAPDPYQDLEAIINWTLPGLTMYYRDTQLSQEAISQYTQGDILRSQAFVDVSNFAGKPTKNCRYIIASSKAAPLYQVSQSMARWKLHVINYNSYLKVLDVYPYETLTQIFLMHIPYQGIDFFSNSGIILNDQNLEAQFVQRARQSLHTKYQGEVAAVLEEHAWVERTASPVGMNDQYVFYPLQPVKVTDPQAVALHSAIRKMTQDHSDLNKWEAAFNEPQ